jgi:DNA replication protein DnaC
MDALMPILTLSPSEPHICPYCNRLVARLQLVVLGINKTVQPYCRCEARAHDQGIQDSVELQHKREIEARFSLSSLGERFSNATFDSFEARPGTEKALEYAKTYASTFPAYGADGLMIWGAHGNGKSHLAAAVAHKVQEKGYTLVFQTMPELLDRIRGTFRNGKNTETEKDIMTALQTCDLLVLDDIGAEKVSDWVQDVLFRIVDDRYRRKKPILYTTNLQPSELKDKIGPRIFDRTMETTIPVQSTATSYRMKLAEARIRQMKNR